MIFEQARPMVHRMLEIQIAVDASNACVNDFKRE